MASSLRGVLALDHQHRDAVDEEDDVLARAVAAVVEVELLGHLEDVAPIAGVGQVVVVDQRQVQLAVVLVVEELALIAQVGEEVAVAGDVGVKPLQARRPARPRPSLYFGLKARTWA